MLNMDYPVNKEKPEQAVMCSRYLDNVVNKQTVTPPIPHLHALLTSGDTPPPEIDVFDLIKSSYEVSLFFYVTMQVIWFTGCR